MTIHYHILRNDGHLDVFGPYDATGDVFHRTAMYWARIHAKAGGVKNATVYVDGVPTYAYRSRPNGGYQRARGFRICGANASPNWRG